VWCPRGVGVVCKWGAPYSHMGLESVHHPRDPGPRRTKVDEGIEGKRRDWTYPEQHARWTRYATWGEHQRWTPTQPRTSVAREQRGMQRKEQRQTRKEEQWDGWMKKAGEDPSPVSTFEPS